MGKYANFYNSIDHDREYNASSMEEWLRPFFVTGVFNGNLQVTADGTSMSVTVSDGYVNIKGKTRWFESSNTLAIAASSGTLSRIDNIVVRRDDAARNITLEVVQGSASETPVAPTPTRTDSVYELVLAHVTVSVGAINISQSNIEDTRPDTDLCGWVTSTVTEMDFNQFTAQFDQYFKEFKAGTLADVTQWYADRQAEYNEWIQKQESDFSDWSTAEKAAFLEWFDGIKGQLSEDAAAKIQAEIDEAELKDILDNGFEASVTTVSADGLTITEVEQVTADGATTDGRKVVTVVSSDGNTITDTLYSASGAVLKTVTTKIDNNVITTS